MSADNLLASRRATDVMDALSRILPPPLDTRIPRQHGGAPSSHAPPPEVVFDETHVETKIRRLGEGRTHTHNARVSESAGDIRVDAVTCKLRDVRLGSGCSQRYLTRPSECNTGKTSQCVVLI